LQKRKEQKNIPVGVRIGNNRFQIKNCERIDVRSRTASSKKRQRIKKRESERRRVMKRNN
jgi:hypothetical protein